MAPQHFEKPVHASRFTVLKPRDANQVDNERRVMQDSQRLMYGMNANAWSAASSRNSTPTTFDALLYPYEPQFALQSANLPRLPCLQKIPEMDGNGQYASDGAEVQRKRKREADVNTIMHSYNPAYGMGLVHDMRNHDMRNNGFDMGKDASYFLHQKDEALINGQDAFRKTEQAMDMFHGRMQDSALMKTSLPVTAHSLASGLRQPKFAYTTSCNYQFHHRAFGFYLEGSHFLLIDSNIAAFKPLTAPICFTTEPPYTSTELNQRWTSIYLQRISQQTNIDYAFVARGYFESLPTMTSASHKKYIRRIFAILEPVDARLKGALVYIHQNQKGEAFKNMRQFLPYMPLHLSNKARLGEIVIMEFRYLMECSMDQPLCCTSFKSYPLSQTFCDLFCGEPDQYCAVMTMMGFEIGDTITTQSPITKFWTLFSNCPMTIEAIVCPYTMDGNGKKICNGTPLLLCKPMAGSLNATTPADFLNCAAEWLKDVSNPDRTWRKRDLATKLSQFLKPIFKKKGPLIPVSIHAAIRTT